MRAWGLCLFAVLFLGVGACTPFSGGTFECTEDTQCDQLADGRCDLASGFCTYADESCASGRRFGDFSGNRSNACVGGSANDGGDRADANPNLADADPNRPDAGCDPSWDPQFFDPCAVVFPIGPLDMPDGVYTYDTDAGTLTHPTLGSIPHATQTITPPGGVQVRIVVADSITIGSTGTLRAEGSLPLMLVSWSTMGIDGAIDVSSGAGTGAGANPTGCSANQATPGVDSAQGGGGGGGGGFQAMGGGGGTGGSSGQGPGGVGGTSISAPTFIRGGCKGARGGAGDGASAPGGDGGGAVHLVAHDSITIAGTIHAGAAGGGGATVDGGGGGGGSGGYISAEAPTMTLTSTAILAANGGGGGMGADIGTSSGGQAGQLGATAAAGGTTGDGGNGGAGGARDAPTGVTGSNDPDGAGAGGGSVGYVIFYGTPATDPTTVVSPNPTQL